MQDLRDLPLATLFQRLAQQLSDLIRNEVRLVGSELLRSVKRAGLALALFGAAAAVGLFVLIALTYAAIAGLSNVMPPWGAALVVAGVYALIAVGCVVAGIGAIKQIAKQGNPMASIEEDLQWVKTRAKFGKP